MAKYVVIHTPVIEEASQDMLFRLMQAIAEAEVPDTEWLSSWMAVDGSKMFCLWEAPGVDAIRSALGEEGLRVSPIDVAYEVVDIAPEYFEQE
ncbi:MAG TPA: nickel-binding protein [Anaerolineae bacterium]|nr:nickel-binding protein [Anaerolineae bacterium]